MGEIADMMIDGTLCEACGEFIDDEGHGFPRYCSRSCSESRGASQQSKSNKAKNQPPLGEKQLKRLKEIEIETDNPNGMYPGIPLEYAPAKFMSLITSGYAARHDPHNPIHKTRVVITDLGRELLKGNKA